MSEPLRLALVVEGPTDRIVIEAAVSSILEEQSFIVTQLQPEPLLLGPHGGGWGGVYRWCRESTKRSGGSVRADPLFESYDVLVLQLDADVARETYGHANIPDDFGDLPCAEPCPPPQATTDRLRRVLLRWAGETTTPDRTVLCTPSKSTEAWILAAAFPNDAAVRSGDLECLRNPASRLGQQPIETRINKNVFDYETLKDTVRDAWTEVTEICTEALRFSDDFRRITADRIESANLD